MVTIILAHPWHGSFNKAIMDTIISKYEKENTPYQTIDLHKDNFNPVYSEEELSLYSQGGFIDPIVGRYQELIKKSDELIFIFPIWWSGMPAILKGFFDKVLLKDFAFNYENGWTPLLSIDKTTIITTADQTTESIINNCGNPIEGCLIPAALNGVGIKNATWINCGQVVKGSDEHRKDFLKKVESIV
ncbi:flavodoxin family protein [Dysgonomonas sp. 216]|uniref:NAD(P)H-dependent oxidoreductase n=1 Tax=Dysgonomonas sp. 216 TaxID=2302934 RepID=UPI0013D1105E|nr:NAD(P)H-dependent oxidoreductase [Dysgonomonas sp. 216]NDW19843.1 flavodoxin family protein [Dysgonomonas sp. 216]